jgi:hypothetical protein
MQQLLDECVGELQTFISAGKLPHRLERKAIIAGRRPVHDGVVQPQPPEILPAYCIVSPEPSELPSVDIDVEMRNEHVLRVREAFKPWFEKAGTSDLFEGMRSLMREARIDGCACAVLPFVPEPGQSIPRKTIASRAFRSHGFESVGRGSSGTLSFGRTLTGGEFEARVEFDFGTWRRTVSAHYLILDKGSNRAAKAQGLHQWYWSHDMEIPLLDEQLFRLTIENTACAAGFLTDALEGKR